MYLLNSQYMPGARETVVKGHALSKRVLYRKASHMHQQTAKTFPGIPKFPEEGGVGREEGM